jgi:hypothetical protein
MDTSRFIPEQGDLPRKSIVIRLLFTVFFLIVFEILKTILQVTVIFQYVYLLITKSYSNPLRRFSDKVSVYTYRVMRYMTLSDNDKPFPFSDFPGEMEEPVNEVEFK